MLDNEEIKIGDVPHTEDSSTVKLEKAVVTATATYAGGGEGAMAASEFNNSEASQSVYEMVDNTLKQNPVLGEAVEQTAKELDDAGITDGINDLADTYAAVEKGDVGSVINSGQRLMNDVEKLENYSQNASNSEPMTRTEKYKSNHEVKEIYLGSRDLTPEEMREYKKKVDKSENSRMFIYDKDTGQSTEKSHKTERITGLSPTDSFKRSLNNRSLGIARYWLAFVNFGVASLRRIQARFSNIGEKMDDIASGDAKSKFKSNLGLEKTKNFINDEIEAVQNYKSLMDQQNHAKAEEILSKRKTTREDFVNSIVKDQKLSPNVLAAYQAYKENEKELTKERLAELYEDPTYVEGLKLYGKRFETIEELEKSINTTSAKEDYMVTMEELKNEYQSSNAELLSSLGYKDFEHDVLLSTNEIDNGYSKNNLEEVQDGLEM